MSGQRLKSLYARLMGFLLSRTQGGAALVEYTLIIGLVALAAVGAAFLLGGFISQDFNNTAQNGFGP